VEAEGVTVYTQGAAISKLEKRRASQIIGEACIELARNRMRVKRERVERFERFDDRSRMRARPCPCVMAMMLRG
jgi:hypothetical protein